MPVITGVNRVDPDTPGNAEFCTVLFIKNYTILKSNGLNCRTQPNKDSFSGTKESGYVKEKNESSVHFIIFEDGEEKTGSRTFTP